MGLSNNLTLCMLGCGNLGLPILQSLLNPQQAGDKAAAAQPVSKFHVCVRSPSSEEKLNEQFRSKSDAVIVSRGDNTAAVRASDVIILAVDPADVESTMTQPGLAEALADDDKLLISVAAGWTRQGIEALLQGDSSDASGKAQQRQQKGQTCRVLRALPNIAAQVGQSMTAVEISEPALPEWCLELADAIFSRVGTTVRVPPSLMDATTAVGGSTPAFFAVICDALIDASVAVGVPRPTAQAMIFQSMLGTATMMKDGLHPGLLKDQGTSPEGCTIGGLMVLEEGAVRGQVGKALREAVTVARLMGKNPHVNDTRQ